MATLKIPVTEEDHKQGSLDAPVILVEYGDYECPACGAAYPIVKLVQEHFSDKLCFVFRNFPLTQVHPHAEMAAETAEFASAHNRFWEMHDGLYENQSRMGTNLFFELAEVLGLSAEKLKEALEQGTFVEKVQQDFMGGVRSGVNGTPTFFINGQRHDGPYGFEDLVAAIEARL